MKNALRMSACTLALLSLTACGGVDSNAPPSGSTGAGSNSPTFPPPPAATEHATSASGYSVAIAPVATFDKPWAMNFLPDGRMLVDEAFYGVRLVTQAGVVSDPIPGLPANLNVPFDILPSRNFATDHMVYLSFAEMTANGVPIGKGGDGLGDDGAGLAVLTATLTIPTSGTPSFTNVKVIWRQTPKNKAAGEFGAKMTFSPDGRYLFISSGDRSTFGPQQVLDNTLGKTIRLFADGTVPLDNPFASQGGVAAEIWTLGHRNPYGIAFDANGKQWQSEHGPAGGDEFNLVEPGANFGWPNVSWGNQYTGEFIIKPAPGDGYAAPAVYWTPAIAPAGLIFYSASNFANWRDQAILGGLQANGLVIVRVTDRSATEVDRLPLKARIRDVRQAPDGSVWVLEDSPTGRLLRLTPG